MRVRLLVVLAALCVALAAAGQAAAFTKQDAETYFVAPGYAVLTYDIRGHGESGGFVTIAGQRELADIRVLEAQFA